MYILVGLISVLDYYVKQKTAMYDKTSSTGILCNIIVLANIKIRAFTIH